MYKNTTKLLLIILLSAAMAVFWGCSKEVGAPASPEVTSGMNFEAQQIRILQKNIERSEAILKNDPNNLHALIDLGNSYYDLGNNQKAVEYYGKALEIDPTNPNVRTDMGTSYKRQGDLARALEEYSKSLGYDSTHSTSYFNMGVVNYSQGSYAEAVANWEKYLELDPNGRMSMVARDNIDRTRKEIEQ